MFDNNSSIINTFKESRYTTFIEGIFVFTDNSCLISKHFSLWSEVITIAVIALIPAFNTVFVNDFFDPCQLFWREDKPSSKAIFFSNVRIIDSSTLVNSDNFSFTVDNSTTWKTWYRSQTISDTNCSLIIILFSTFNNTVRLIQLTWNNWLLQFWRRWICRVTDGANRFSSFVFSMFC